MNATTTTKNIFFRTVDTKPCEGLDVVTTDLTLDCSELTTADFQEYAIKGIVIAWQAGRRRKALAKENAEPIPTKYTLVVKKPGSRSAKPSIEEQLLALSPELKRALMQKLMASMSEETDGESEE